MKTFFLPLALATGCLLVPPARAEQPGEVEAVKDVAYDDGADADPVKHRLDLYLPKGRKDFPVLFFVHGGAWKSGDKKTYTPLGELFARRGLGTVIINYRLSPAVKHPAHIQDVAKAFAWTHANIGKYGGRADAVFACGHSAGGHLVALLVLLAALALGTGLWFAGAGAEPPAKAAPFQEYDQPFEGKPDDLRAFEWGGPDAEERVTNEPGGLRISLPPRSPDIFVTLVSTVKGDFDITTSFEILSEPDPAHVGEEGTRVTLGVLLDTPGWAEGSVSRRMGPTGATQFFTFLSPPRGATGNGQAQMGYFPTEAKGGRLRLVRTGSVLSCSASEGAGGDFTALRTYPFSALDLKQVHLIASSGGSEAPLDVRIQDLRIQAESLPNLAGASQRREGGRGWLAAGVILGLLLAAASGLGIWLLVRQRRRLGEVPPPPAGGLSRRRPKRPPRLFPSRVRAAARTSGPGPGSPARGSSAPSAAGPCWCRRSRQRTPASPPRRSRRVFRTTLRVPGRCPSWLACGHD